MSVDQLQAGIYLAPSSPPPPAWRLLLLDVPAGTAAAAASSALRQVMAMLGDLQAGQMAELQATRPDEEAGTVPADGFEVLLGLGPSFFDAARHEPPLTPAPAPAHLVELDPSDSAFPSLPWKSEASAAGQADLALQLTGVSEHAVDRAAVEVCKLIADRQLPLTTVGSFDGFQRDDGRSWIGFHDGVSNIEPSQRLAAVQSNGDPAWNQGGTFLAFLRIEIALATWRALDRDVQEAIVGRDKITGCPLVSAKVVDGRPQPKTIGGCPVSGDADWRARDAFFNPPESGDALVEVSHIHRVNQNRGAGSTRAGHRIFRQGYEYLEAIGPDGPTLGLNFVSFQNDLEHLRQVLSLEGWLGDVNFGGPTIPGPGEPQPPALMSLVAGGFYAVPPRATPFPGAGLFTAFRSAGAAGSADASGRVKI